MSDTLTVVGDFDEHGRAYYFSEHLDKGGNSKEIDQGDNPKPCSKEQANLISSLCQDGMHRPVLDIDFPVRLVPSTTPGHFHLYVDVPMTWTQQLALMAGMRAAGILQQGFEKFSQVRGMSFVRPPGVMKPPKSEPEPVVATEELPF